MQLIIILLLLVVLILALLSCFLFVYYLKINKAINLFLEKGKVKDLRDVLFSQSDALKELESRLKDSNDRIKLMEDVSKITLQKVGVVRFNPFNDYGGNQSFVIALLDGKNNGFVISSLFMKEGNRVYAKSIMNGASDYVLSNEEKEAIMRAVNLSVTKPVT